jgi:Protein of unknown function (DUF507)
MTSPVRILGGLRIGDRVNFEPAYRLHCRVSNSGAIPQRPTLQSPGRTTKSSAVRTSSAQIERVAETLARRLVETDLLTPAVPEQVLRERFAAVLSTNFAEEAEIERQAEAEAAKLIRQGAPGVRREDLDPRRVEQLVKQRIAKAKGFAL